MCFLDAKHMNGASPTREKCNEMNGSSPVHNMVQHINEDGSKVVVGAQSVDVGQLKPILESTTIVDSSLRRGNMQQSALKNSKRGRPKGKKVLSKLGCRKYSLRSSLDGVRVLRSMSNGECRGKDAPKMGNNMLHLNNENGKKRKRRKRRNCAVIDEFSRIRQRVRYLLSRMSYEQSLIEAYSGEGWRGQSQEKIRPEMELQRATSEILRCKSKVRENFQRIDSLCSEGKFQESLFDSEGQINAEDIFCAKCGSKDLSANNDIILCDGACDRGFHQKCLTPPLSSDEIPPGDESWLCPGCDCKADCIELVNDIRGTDLSIEDKWEKVFPEAAARAAKDEQLDDLGLPSDDSEDDDYDPHQPNPNGEISEDGSNFEEFDSSSTSDDSSASTKDKQHGWSTLSSDDSEDDGFDPNALDINENFQKAGSISDESDFSSDTDDLNVFIGGDDDSPRSDALTRGLLEDSDPISKSSEQQSRMNVGKRKLVNSEVQSLLGQDTSDEIAAPISGKRQHVRLDYKRLHDETYGDISSDSSDDEDWTEKSSPKKEKNGSAVPSKGNNQIMQDRQHVVGAQSLSVVKDAFPTPIIDVLGITDKTPSKKTFLAQEDEGINYSVAKQQKDNPKRNCSEIKASRSGFRGFGPVVSQRLAESFRENAYPTKLTREHLAKELGITILQVSTWFSNARRNLHHWTKKETNKAENGPLGDQINVNVVELGTKAVSNFAGNGSEDVMSSKAEVKQPVMMRLGDGIVSHGGKGAGHGAAAVSSCGCEGKLMGNKVEVVFKPVTMGAGATSEGRRKVAVSRSCWDSAKYESRKRRMEMANGSPNSALRAGGKLSKGKAADSLQVQQATKRGKNASSHASSSKIKESLPNTIQKDNNQHRELKSGKAADQSEIILPQREGQTAKSCVSTSEAKGVLSPETIIEGLAAGPFEDKGVALPTVLQRQMKGQDATPYCSHIQTRSRRAIT